MWLITYDDGHGRPVMIRRVATEHEAFDQALCFVAGMTCSALKGQRASVMMPKQSQSGAWRAASEPVCSKLGAISNGASKFYLSPQ